MGLDMYLTGEVNLPPEFYYETNLEGFSIDDPIEGESMKSEGFHVDRLTLDIAQWRKHPDLHGFIVQTFADGKDECQKISLKAEDLDLIIDAVIKDKLPKTTGFFFGDSGDVNSSDPEEAKYAQRIKDETIVKLGNAKKWLTKKDLPKGEYRYLSYQASW